MLAVIVGDQRQTERFSQIVHINETSVIPTAPLGSVRAQLGESW